MKTYKYPDISHYEWEGELLEATEDYVLVLCKPNRVLKHYTKNAEFVLENTAVEYFSLKEGFTVSMSIEDNRIVQYYCNICMPCTFDGDVLSFVDLDLDYVKRRGKGFEVVDEDEFLENQLKYQYPKELISFAVNTLDELKQKVKNKISPFDLTHFYGVDC